MRPGSAEVIVVRKRLKPGSFPDRKAAALSLVVVDVVMSIFGHVADDRGRWLVEQLHPESVVKVLLLGPFENVLMPRKQSGRKVT